MNLIDIISKNSRIYPSETALVELKPLTKVRKEISWNRFEERVTKLANSLRDMGVNRGDRVLLFGRNSIHWLEVYFAVLKTGAWIAPLNYRFSNEDILYCAKVSQAVVCFCDEEFDERMLTLQPNLPTIKRIISIGEKVFEGLETLESIIERSSSRSFEVELKDEDACGLYFTSGTTDRDMPLL
jgi:fatty-acyl-CoA synthase